MPHNINKNKQTCRPCKGQNKMAVTLEVGQLLRVKCKNSSPSKIIWGYFGAPYGPQKYIFAKINPTIVFSAKNYYTHLYRATLAHSEYSGTYFFRFGLKIAIFRAFWGPCMPPKKYFSQKWTPPSFLALKTTTLSLSSTL